MHGFMACNVAFVLHGFMACNVAFVSHGFMACPLHPLCQLDREDTSLTRTLGSALGRLSERIDAWLDAMLVL